MKRLICLWFILLCATLHTSAAHAQWVQTNGPYGGSVFSITHIGNALFIGTYGGVFESTDGGSNWNRRTSELPENPYVIALQSQGTNLFAGSMWYRMFCSTDSGTTWTHISLGFPPNLGFSISSLGSSSGAILVPAAGYLFIGTEDGTEWVKADTNLTNFSNPESFVTIDSTTYAAGRWVTTTTNDGSTWTVTGISPSDTAWSITALANIGNVLIAYDENLGIRRSFDEGFSWESANNGLPNPKNNYYFGNIFATLGNEIFAIGSDGSIYRSIDTAQSWQLASFGLPNGVRVNTIASVDTELLAGFTGFGLYRSFDSGVTWFQCNQGLLNTSVNCMTSVNDTTVAATNEGIFVSADNGVSWQMRDNPFLLSNFTSLLLDGGNLFAGASNWSPFSSLLVSSDLGNYWNVIGAPMTDYSTYTMIRAGNNLLAGGEDNVYWSLNNGASWNLSLKAYIYNFLKFGSSILASTNIGIFASNDDGITWNESDSGIPFIQQLAINTIGSVGTKLFSNHLGMTNLDKGLLFMSDDTSVSWHRTIDTSVPPRGEIETFASAGNNLFVATDSDGIFLTTDYGASWARENLGLGDSSIVSLAVQGNELLAGTASSGVWRRPLAEMIPASSVASGKQIANTISVYPDPASNMVTVSCPNLKGATEASLVSEIGITVWHRTINADGRPFQLDLTGVANGTYRLTFVSGGVSKATTIVLRR
jgi:photosystem II stability/assembly factor-like uncharacterized protein